MALIAKIIEATKRLVIVRNHYFDSRPTPSTGSRKINLTRRIIENMQK